MLSVCVCVARRRLRISLIVARTAPVAYESHSACYAYALKDTNAPDCKHVVTTCLDLWHKYQPAVGHPTHTLSRQPRSSSCVDFDADVAARCNNTRCITKLTQTHYA